VGGGLAIEVLAVEVEVGREPVAQIYQYDTSYRDLVNPHNFNERNSGGRVSLFQAYFRPLVARSLASYYDRVLCSTSARVWSKRSEKKIRRVRRRVRDRLHWWKNSCSGGWGCARNQIEGVGI